MCCLRQGIAPDFRSLIFIIVKLSCNQTLHHRAKLQLQRICTFSSAPRIFATLNIWHSLPSFVKNIDCVRHGEAAGNGENIPRHVL